MNISTLTTAIVSLHDSLRSVAISSVNRLLTMRNWIIGMYIVEYEQKGEDRAAYGSALLERLSSDLLQKKVKGTSVAALKNCRQFYLEYRQLGSVFIQSSEIGQKPSGEFSTSLFIPLPGEPQIQQKPSVELQQQIDNKKDMGNSLQPDLLIRQFSFSHFVELMRLDDPLKRTFYEVEGIKGCWSVPQLKRQIESLLYERTGLSREKRKLVEDVHAENKTATIDQMIRDPYILEFTGLPERAYYSEVDLETALLDHLQAFLLELGNGFCFEARQKRITLDNEHDRIDLVFFHRILRCHVLIDLKIRKFMHTDAGQMNFYLNYYRENEMAEGDNPPVGLILCTGRDETRVRYATAGMDNRLFVSKYLTVLPSEEQIQAFLENDRGCTENMLLEQCAVYAAKPEGI